jgi:hypothetical protein
MNKFGIPAEIESAIRARDVECVYCQKAMVPPTSTPNRANWATIEHLDHLPPFRFREGQTADDFAIACGSCNSNRRDKPLWVFIAKRGHRRYHRASHQSISGPRQSYRSSSAARVREFTDISPTS